MKKVAKLSHFAILALIATLKGFCKKVLTDRKTAVCSKLSAKRINMKKIVRFHRQRKTGLPEYTADQKAKPVTAKPVTENIGQVLMFTGVRYEHNRSLRYENAAKKTLKEKKPLKNGQYY